MHLRWRLAVIGAAAAAAAVPLPPPWVERAYSTAVYPALQRRLTSLSNRLPFAGLDLLIAAALAAWLIALVLDLRRGRGALLRAAIRTLVWAAAGYLLFLAAWGLNYRREPLVAKLDFDPSRVSAPAAVAAAEEAAAGLNGLHDRAHAIGWTPRERIDSALASGFSAVLRDLGARSPAILGRPKTTFLDWYLRRAGVDGMTDPFLLETLIQRDLLPFERPFVVAHEWGHLAGFADEADASFAGWLACLRGSPADQYSGWLFLYRELDAGLESRDRRRVAARLAAGPRTDLAAVARRYRRDVSPRVSAAGWQLYDRYLKANRVEAGAASYDQVIRLVLGVRLGPGWTPIRKPAAR